MESHDFARICRDAVVPDQLDGAVEPIGRHLREYGSLVGYRLGQDAIEGTDAIARNEQQVIAQFVDLADFSLPQEGQWKVRL